MNNREAADKLCANLLRLDPDDAREFAAYVAAKVALGTGQAPENAMRLVDEAFIRLRAEGMNPDRRDPTGNCSDCLAPSWVEPGNLVVHAGYACAGFRLRFPRGGDQPAKDQLGWSNEQRATASEKQVPVVGTTDDSGERFALLELDLDNGPKKKPQPQEKPERMQLEMK